MTNILAIDPGTEKSGFVIWDGVKIIDKGIMINEKITDYMYKENCVDYVFIEMVASYGMPVGREVFETVLWTGRFYESWDRELPVKLIYRKEIKMYFCNTMRAKDANIRRALIDRFGYWEHGKTGQGTKKHPGLLYGLKLDMWSALAIAVYCYDKLKNEVNFNEDNDQKELFKEINNE